MNLLSLFFALTLIGGHVNGHVCKCRHASEGESPQEGNELIEISHPPVKRIRGKVTDINGAPLEAVIEVYRDTKSAKVFQLPQPQKKITACVTQRDGEFCITGLSPARYLLKVGEYRSGGFNAVYIKVRVASGAKAGGNEKLVVELPVAT